jgi:hypothetical protein
MKKTISRNEKTSYKKKCISLYYNIVKRDFNSSINDLSKRGLKFEVTIIKNPVYQWIYSFFRSKDALSYNAPYLLSHTESDINKRYIFWTKQRLEGIKFNLEKILKQ